MQLQLDKIIDLLAKDIQDKLPKSFEKKYYKKMSYSNNNIVLDLEKDLLIKTISFEIAFIHVVIYILIKILNCEKYSYIELLKKLDSDELFSWYVPEEYFINEYLGKINIEENSDIYLLINQHDKLIHKDVKKKLGQFYTPINIVQRMISDINSDLNNIKMQECIVDPACGTGVFLVETLKVLKNKFSLDELIEYTDQSIYAFDVNPFAIVATKINLLYELCMQAEYKYKLEKLIEIIFNSKIIFKNIKLKNTVAEDDYSNYKIILGNPPYFKLNSKLIKEISGYQEIVYGQPNIYSFFMYWGMKHLVKNGVMCFIIPQSIRSGLYFKKLRAQIYNFKIKSIIYIDSRQKVFDRAEQAVMVLCLENKSVINTKTKIQFYCSDGIIYNEFKIPRSKLMLNETYNNNFVINRKLEMYDILDKVYSNSASLDSDQRKLKFSNGLFVWNQHKEEIVDYERESIPIIYGGNVQSLEFNFNQCSSNKERMQFARITDKTKSFILTGKRLLVQRTTNFEKDIRLKACIISDSFLEKYKMYLLENHVNFLCDCNGKDKLLEEKILYYYLGMLNSRLVNYIFISKSGNTQVSANELNLLPFPRGEIDTIANFVRKYEGDLYKHQDELDLLVCHAYGLSEKETNFIIKY